MLTWVVVTPPVNQWIGKNCFLLVIDVWVGSYNLAFWLAFKLLTYSLSNKSKISIRFVGYKLPKIVDTNHTGNEFLYADLSHPYWSSSENITSVNSSVGQTLQQYYLLKEDPVSSESIFFSNKLDIWLSLIADSKQSYQKNTSSPNDYHNCCKASKVEGKLKKHFLCKKFFCLKIHRTVIHKLALKDYYTWIRNTSVCTIHPNFLGCLLYDVQWCTSGR